MANYDYASLRNKYMGTGNTTKLTALERDISFYKPQWEEEDRIKKEKEKAAKLQKELEAKKKKLEQERLKNKPNIFQKGINIGTSFLEGVASEANKYNPNIKNLENDPLANIIQKGINVINTGDVAKQPQINPLAKQTGAVAENIGEMFLLNKGVSPVVKGVSSLFKTPTTTAKIAPKTVEAVATGTGLGALRTRKNPDENLFENIGKETAYMLGGGLAAKGVGSALSKALPKTTSVLGTIAKSGGRGAAFGAGGTIAASPFEDQPLTGQDIAINALVGAGFETVLKIPEIKSLFRKNQNQTSSNLSTIPDDIKLNVESVNKTLNNSLKGTKNREINTALDKNNRMYNQYKKVEEYWDNAVNDVKNKFGKTDLNIQEQNIFKNSTGKNLTGINKSYEKAKNNYIQSVKELEEAIKKNTSTLEKQVAKNEIMDIYGLNQKASPENIRKSFMDMYDDIGMYISKQNNTKNLDKILSIYQKKYDLPGKLIVKPYEFKSENMLGRTVYKKDGTIEIKINPNLSEGQKIGILRHEIEHVKDKVRDFKGQRIRYSEGKTIDEIYTTGKHHKDYNFFEKDYILNKKIARGEPTIQQEIKPSIPEKQPIKQEIKPAEKITELPKEQNLQIKETPKKVSKFKETVKKTQPEEVKKQLPSKEYGTVTNKETWEKAQEKVKANYDKVKQDIYNKKSFETAQDTADSQAVLKKMLNDGDYVQANNFLDHVSLKLTKAGQTIQAASIWRRLTPEGALKYYSNKLNKAQQKFKTDKISAIDKQVQTLRNQIKKLESNPNRTESMNSEIVEKTKTLRKLTSDNKYKQYENITLNENDIKYLKNEYTKIQKMEDGYAKDFAIAKVNSYVAEKIPSSVLSKISAVQTINQLLNPKTMIRNVIGNLLFAGVENFSQVVKTGLDVAIPGDRNYFLPNIKAQGKAFIEGGKRGITEAKHGVDTSRLGTQYDIEQKTFNPKGNLFEKFYSKLETALGISLKGADKAFYQASFERDIYNQAKKMLKAENKAFTQENIISKLDKVNPEQASLAGVYSTFQDTNSISWAFSTIKKALNRGKEWGLGDVILKYPKTPANLLARGIDYSPIAIGRSLARIAYNAAKGENFNKQKLINDLGNGLTGSAIMMAGAVLYNMNILEPGYSKNQKIESLKKDIGVGNYTINISALKRYVGSGFNENEAVAKTGDKIITYDWLQPIAPVATAGAEMAKQKKSNADTILGSISTVLDSSINSLEEQPMLRGLQDFMKYGLDSGIRKAAQSMPSSFIPTLLGQARQVADNERKYLNVENAKNKTEIEKIKELGLNLIKNKVPFLSKTLQTKYTTEGKADTYYKRVNPVVDFANAFISPSSLSQYDNDKTKKLLIDIYRNSEENKETGHIPRVAPKQYTIDGEKIQLSNKDQAEIQQYIGKRSYQELNDLVKYGINDYTDEEKVKIISSIYDRIGKEAKYMILDKK